MSQKSDMIINNLAINYLFKSEILGNIIVFFESMSIMVAMIASNYINNSQSKSSYSENLKYLDPLYFTKLIYTCELFQDQTYCNIPPLYFGIIMSIIFGFCIISGFTLLAKENKLEKSKVSKIYYLNEKINYFSINYFDMVYHVLGIGVIHICFSTFKLAVLNIYFSKSSLGFNIVMIILAILFLVMFSIYYLMFINYSCVIFNFDKSVSLKYDSKFSVKYDKWMFLLKLIIALEDNISDFISQLPNLLLCLCYTEIVVFILFFLFIFVSLYRKKLLFLINTRLNLFRIFLITLTFLLWLCESIFTLQLMELELYIFTFITVIIFSFCISRQFNILNRKIIFAKDNLLYQVIFLFNNSHFLKDNELHSLCDKVNLFHNLNCDLSCGICLECFENYADEKSGWIKYTQLIKNYISEIKKQSKENKEFFKQNEVQLFQVFKIIIQNREVNTIKCIYKLKTLIEKIKPKTAEEKVFSFNLFCLLQKENGKNIELNRICNVIRIYEETCISLRKSIETKESIFLDLEHNFSFNKNLYESLSILQENKNLCIKNLNQISTFREIYKDEYQFIILSIVYNCIFNTSLSIDINQHYEEDLQSIEYILDKITNSEEYNKPLIKVKYSLKDDLLVIQQASKALKKYNGENFENLFYPFLKNKIKENFIKSMFKSENNRLSFSSISSNLNLHLDSQLEIETLNSLDTRKNYIQLINFRFSIYPSFNIEDFILIGRYDMVGQDILLTEINTFTQNEIIIAFSEGVGNVLLLNPSWISHLNKIGSGMKKSEVLQPHYKEEPPEIKFKSYSSVKIDYKKYDQIMTNYFNSLQEFFGEEEISYTKQRLNNLANSDYQLDLYLKKQSSISNFNLYSIKHDAKNNRRASLKLNSNTTEPTEEENSQFGMEKRINTARLQSTTTSGTGEVSLFRGKSKQNKENCKDSSRSALNKLNWILLIANFFIIILSLYYLIVIIQQNGEVNKAISLQTKYFLFQYDFTHVSFYSFLFTFIYNQNSTDASIYNAIFGGYMGQIQGLNPKFIAPYFNFEFAAIVDNLYSEYADFKNSADSFGVLDELNYPTEYFLLSTTDFTLVRQNITLFEFFDMSLENFRIGMKSAISLIYLIDYKGVENVSFENIYNRNLTAYQKIQYETLINFFNLHNLIIKLRTNISNNETSVFTQLLYETIQLL